jgi:fatty-acyl-CoA synthase
MRPILFSEATRLERAKANAAEVRDDAMITADAPKPWGGMSVAASQTAYYDTAPEEDANPNRKDKPYLGIRPLIMKDKPADVLLAARRALEFKGWKVRDARVDQIEAVAISPWYGLVADVAVRVTPEVDGSRIDIRSTSRTATPDLGANAGRVRSLTTDIAAALRDVRTGKSE